MPAWTRSSALAVAGIMAAASAAGLAVATASNATAQGKAAGHGKVLAATARGRSSAGQGSGGQGSGGQGSGGQSSGGQGSRGQGAHGQGTRGAKTASPLVKADVGGRQLASQGIVVNQPATGALKLPKIRASAFVIADAGTGAVLAAKDAHGLHPPASTLKMLTAITMLPRLKPGQFLVATKLAASAEPNIVGLTAGRAYKVSDLFHALLLISANDAAVALIQGSGSYADGLALMNAQAHQLQAYDVVAKNPNGLPAAGQVVSAYDMALIARRALAMPAFMTYDSTLTAKFPYKRHKSETLVNQNYLLTQYQGGIGGKIGWTVAAGATYIGLARRDGVTLIVTLLHAPSLTEIHSAEKLLNWGFAMDGKVSPVGELVPPLTQSGKKAPAKSGASHPAGAALGGAGNQASYSGTGAGLAAALCVLMLGAVALFRRRVIEVRRPQPAAAGPASGEAAVPAVVETSGLAPPTISTSATLATGVTPAPSNDTALPPD